MKTGLYATARNSKAWRVAAAVFLMLLVGTGTVLADMTIILKDGRKFVLPVKPGEIESIEFDAAGKSGSAAQPKGNGNSTSLAERAARKEGRVTGKVQGSIRAPAGTPAQRLAGGRVLRVGPGRTFTIPSQAAKAVRDNDVVEIDAGTYRADVAVWRANNLVLKAVGGRVHLDAAGRSAEGKATWVIKGRNTTVDGVEFSGSRVRDLNGAGIRLEGSGLTVRNSYFHDNEMGLLTGSNAESDIVIEYSEFARNTVDYHKTGRLGHNIYIGNVRSFTLRHSYIHDATIGHNVKSRAQTNKILYNRIMDGPTGGSSYLVDLSNGGRSYLVGNVFHQSPKNDNASLINFSAEGATNVDQRLFIINNTFVNDDVKGTFVQNRGPESATIKNNILVGPGMVVTGAAEISNNLLARSNAGGDVEAHLYGDDVAKAYGKASGNRLVRDAGLVDRQGFDYRLKKSSPAINTAGTPGIIDGFALTPTHVYVSPGKTAERKTVGSLDIGAYEFGG